MKTDVDKSFAAVRRRTTCFCVIVSAMYIMEAPNLLLFSILGHFILILAPSKKIHIMNY
jgi:hypothetical protein